MKKTKRWLAAACAALLLTSVLASCGDKASDSEDVTLRWVIPFTEQADYETVTAQVNEKLETLLPHTKLELVLDGSMSSKWSLWMAGGTSFDIAHSGFATDLQTEINAESYLPLNDLMEQYAPGIKEQSTGVFHDLYQTGTYKGELYAIPIPQIYVKEALSITIPDSLSQYMDIKALVDACYASATTTETVYQLLDGFLHKCSEAKALGTDTISNLINPEYMYMIAQRGYEFIGGVNSSACYKMPGDGGVKIVDFHQTDEFKAYIKWMSKWYAEGYVSKDILTGGGAGSRCYVIECHKTDRMNEQADHTKTLYDGSVKVDRRYILVTNPEHNYKGAYTLGDLQTFLSIPATSQHPERAMQLLELLNTEKGFELLNLITFGIEGQHYDKRSDTEITARDYQGQGNSKSAYGIPPWMTGSMFNQYIINPYTQATRDYAWNYFTQTRGSMPTTQMYGYSFDSAGVTMILTNLSLINQEYEKQLTSGVYADYSSVYETMNSKTAAAEIGKLLAEYQKQADEYLAKK